MRLSSIITSALVASTSTDAVSLPISKDTKDLALRHAESATQFLYSVAPVLDSRGLERRKGGGGKGGGGGSSSGGGKSGGSSSSSSSGGGSTSRTSNSGGQTKSGSGTKPAYGGGRFYGGGAAVPYQSGKKSAKGIAPFLLVGGALAFFPGVWLYGAYVYPYTHFYNFHNASALNATNQNVTLPVKCLCAQYSVCGCDDQDDDQFFQDLLGNGTKQLDPKLAVISDVNGTRTLSINGTLENGTTAAGGQDSSSTSSPSPSTSFTSIGYMGRNMGYMGMWALVAAVGAAIMTI